MNLGGLIASGAGGRAGGHRARGAGHVARGKTGRERSGAFIPITAKKNPTLLTPIRMHTLVGGYVDQWTMRFQLAPERAHVAAPRYSLYIYIFLYSI